MSEKDYKLMNMKGNLLVSLPTKDEINEDDLFHQSVILISEQNEKTITGVVINKDLHVNSENYINDARVVSPYINPNNKEELMEYIKVFNLGITHGQGGPIGLTENSIVHPTKYAVKGSNIVNEYVSISSGIICDIVIDHMIRNYDSEMVEVLKAISVMHLVGYSAWSSTFDNEQGSILKEITNGYWAVLPFTPEVVNPILNNEERWIFALSRLNFDPTRFDTNVIIG